MVSRPTARRLVFTATVIAVLFSGIQAASAHTTLEGATPTAGAVVGGRVDVLGIQFYLAVTEPIITLTSPSGEVVEGSVEAVAPTRVEYRFSPLVETGEYIVEWSVVTPDGHRTAAAYAFSYDPSAPPPPPQPELPAGSSGPTILIVLVLALFCFGLAGVVSVRRRRRRSAKRSGSTDEDRVDSTETRT